MTKKRAGGAGWCTAGEPRSEAEGTRTLPDVYQRIIEAKQERYDKLRRATAILLYTRNRLAPDAAPCELGEIHSEIAEAKRALLRCRQELGDLERERIRVVATLSGLWARRHVVDDADEREALHRVRDRADRAAAKLAAECELADPMLAR